MRALSIRQPYAKLIHVSTVFVHRSPRSAIGNGNDAMEIPELKLVRRILKEFAGNLMLLQDAARELVATYADHLDRLDDLQARGEAA